MISAINSIHTCDKSVIECSEMNNLIEIMKECINDDFEEKHVDHSPSILNYFHHFLLFHSKDNSAFEMVNKLLNYRSCDPLKYLRRRNKNYRMKINIDHKLISINEIVDKIHCHFLQSYDIGHRLGKHEPLYVNNDIDENKCNQFIANIPRNQKFTTDICSISNYSYSFPFGYTKKFKHSTTKILNWKCYELYVPPKYANLKDELTNNTISTITIEQFHYLYKNATYNLQTDIARSIIAETENYITDTTHFVDHPIYFGYRDGDPIQTNHLISVLLYCNYDCLQYEFSATFRKTHCNQTLEDIILRHSNFRHFARYLKESVQVFGTQYINGNVIRVYSGINKQMLFNSTTPEIFGPLSTTYDHTVAIHFAGSNYTGMMIELVPDAELKYFSCQWLSKFSHENEILFFGGFGRINLVDLNSMRGDYGLYIKALRMIDTMTQGVYFMDDPSDIHTIKEHNYCKDVSKLQLEPLRSNEKQMCWRLICDKLHREKIKTN
eukprot:189651_1